MSNEDTGEGALKEAGLSALQVWGASFGRIEPHLEDVSRVAHPLRRIGERARRSGS